LSVLREKISVDSIKYLGGKFVWLIYFLLSLCLVFSLFYLANYFGLSFFVLSHRGMIEHTISGSLISATFDLEVWSCGIFAVLAWFIYGLISRWNKGSYPIFAAFVLLGLTSWVILVVFDVVSLGSLSLMSLSLIFTGFVFSKFFFGISRVCLFSRLLLGSILLFLCFEVTTLILFNFPVTLNIGYGVVSLHWNNVELSFSNLAYPFLPYIYLFFVLLGVFGFIIKALPVGMSSKIKNERFRMLLGRLRCNIEVNEDNGFIFLKNRFVLILAVLFGAIVSCLFVVFTVLPWTNPTNILVSADSPVYYQQLVFMRSVDFNGALSFAFANDRVLFLVLGYALSYITSPLIVVQYVAAFLIVAFGIVSLFVLRLFSSFRVVWFIGVLLVPFSFQALGLVYSGYFANMLAIILVFVYVGLFFRLVDHWSSLGFFALISMSVFVLFSHSWTWFIFALTLGAFLFLEWRSVVYDKKLWSRFRVECICVGTTVGVGLLCDLVRRIFSPSSSIVSVLSTVQSSSGFLSAGYLGGLQNAVDFSLGGVFANQLLIFLSIIGLLVLIKLKSNVSNFFVSWVFVAAMSISFAVQDFGFYRSLFLMPWAILSSFGLYSVVRFLDSGSLGRKGSQSWITGLVLVFVTLGLLNISLRYLFNINIG
jgi:hypothetical protein